MKKQDDKRAEEKPVNEPVVLENIPVWKRYLLTVLEAAEYYHIGENKLRNIIELHSEADFLIMNGNRYLIKKEKFETFLSEATVL